MSAFDEEEFDIDMAIEQSLFDEGTDFFPPPQSVGQPAPQQQMPSWMDGVDNDAPAGNSVAPSVPPLHSGIASASTSLSSISFSPLLPVASGDSTQQISAAVDSNDHHTRSQVPIVPTNRRRLTGKRGNAQTTKDMEAEALLRTRPQYTAFLALSREAQTQARKYVRTYLNRRLKQVKQGQTMRLNTGVLLHCPSREEYELHEVHVRLCLLLDLALNDNANPDHIGAAACRWFEERCKALVPNGRPKRASASSNACKSNQVLVTWHGDFGASHVITAGMDQLMIKDLVELVRQSP